MAEAWLYDGQSAIRRIVAVSAEGGALHMDGEALPASELMHVESRADAEVYGRRGMAGWRLGLAKPVPADVAALLPQRQVYGRLIDRLGLARALAIGGVISAAILFAGYKAPQWLAPLVPESLERRYGDALVGNFGERFCARPSGERALRKLTARLTDRADRLNVRVVDLRMVNALALPGGNIVIFRGLLEEAESPDEAAGVLAHEIAHVEERHVTEALIRSYGFSLLLASLGGTTGGNVEMLTAASYSRASESEADEGAIESLRRAGISPLPTARFFERLGKQEIRMGQVGEALSYFSSHPLSETRRQRFIASAERGRRYTSSLGQAEWDALQDICYPGK